MSEPGCSICSRKQLMDQYIEVGAFDCPGCGLQWRYQKPTDEEYVVPGWKSIGVRPTPLQRVLTELIGAEVTGIHDGNAMVELKLHGIRYWLNIESSLPVWFSVGRQKPDGSIEWIERDTVDEEVLTTGEMKKKIAGELEWSE